MKDASPIPRQLSFALIVAACCFAWSIAPAMASRQNAAPIQQQHWIGYITDTHCGTHCQVTSKMKPDLKCVRLCVRKGSKYGLWTGNQVYVLNPQTLAAQFAAQQVKVTGTITNGVIRAVFIVPVPLQKKSSAPKS